ncbi:hypothetical protein ACI3PL_27895, partial [Lacticaseibacillus paracasei]
MWLWAGFVSQAAHPALGFRCAPLQGIDMADITTTNSNSYPDWAAPYASGFLQRAQQVTDQPYQAYQGDRVAGMAPWQQQGLQ